MQRLHISKPAHGSLSSSKRVMRILRRLLSRWPTSRRSALPTSLIAAEYAESPSVTTLRGRPYRNGLLMARSYHGQRRRERCLTKPTAVAVGNNSSPGSSASTSANLAAARGIILILSSILPLRAAALSKPSHSLASLDGSNNFTRPGENPSTTTPPTAIGWSGSATALTAQPPTSTST
jgi:hypothetical protein